eukprot:gnl/MRDRNA2_/MRDRNA2_75457_c0_seq3.p1 gnl/MRDRNA2_/MRDRNA2_75457_c0~~gnl/MRDRNA2_/MRDRNA2_75457_c0_seq3.p1  ORF type:complete len:158 (+),score=21.34 gnl/MRDRNA2_/MRDRNA2_75457_c0_seq3:74-547(+)
MPRDQRSAVLSGYAVQVTSLQLLGKSMYPAWDFGLQHMGLAERKLLRYRIHMSICSFFCVFGLGLLLMPRIRRVIEQASQASKVSDNRGESPETYGTQPARVIFGKVQDPETEGINCEEGDLNDIRRAPSVAQPSVVTRAVSFAVDASDGKIMGMLT